MRRTLLLFTAALLLVLVAAHPYERAYEGEMMMRIDDAETHQGHRSREVERTHRVRDVTRADETQLRSEERDEADEEQQDDSQGAAGIRSQERRSGSSARRTGRSGYRSLADDSAKENQSLRKLQRRRWGSASKLSGAARRDSAGARRMLDEFQEQEADRNLRKKVRRTQRSARKSMQGVGRMVDREQERRRTRRAERREHRAAAGTASQLKRGARKQKNRDQFASMSASARSMADLERSKLAEAREERVERRQNKLKKVVEGEMNEINAKAQRLRNRERRWRKSDRRAAHLRDFNNPRRLFRRGRAMDEKAVHRMGATAKHAVRSFGKGISGQVHRSNDRRRLRRAAKTPKRGSSKAAGVLDGMRRTIRRDSRKQRGQSRKMWGGKLSAQVRGKRSRRHTKLRDQQRRNAREGRALKRRLKRRQKRTVRSFFKQPQHKIAKSIRRFRRKAQHEAHGVIKEQYRQQRKVRKAARQAGKKARSGTRRQDRKVRRRKHEQDAKFRRKRAHARGRLRLFKHGIAKIYNVSSGTVGPSRFTLKPASEVPDNEP